MDYFKIYLWAINILTFIVYGIDKRKAMREEWRIPEKTLLGLALIGGSVGAFAGMRFFHHKTQKPLFFLGIPLLFCVQIVAMFYVIH